jgi:hypothetical protein
MLQFHVQMGYQITETLFAVQATPPVLQGLSVRYRQGFAPFSKIAYSASLTPGHAAAEFNYTTVPND